MTQLRCAIYTRKSSEEGLEQDFNSLHAQREACEAYIKSQKHEGWHLIKTAYDDGGISGGTMQRPALQQLLEDIKSKKVDVIVVYKVDRLTRALADFARMVELFDQHQVSFVSITQQFNTTTSMGRLTLNVLLSFAQFEREVTGERIRDKIKASKQKGIFMGGRVPLGYEVKDRKLLIKPDEADLVKRIYSLYLELGSISNLKVRLEREGIRGRSTAGKDGMVRASILSRGALYGILTNPMYIGKISHKGMLHDGQHEPLIEQDLWDQVQVLLGANRCGIKSRHRDTEPSPMMGKLFDQNGQRLVPVHTQKRGRRFRYYITPNPNAEDNKDGWRLPAKEIERLVIQLALKTLSETTAAKLQETGISSPDVTLLMRRMPQLAAMSEEGDILALVGRASLGTETITLQLNLKSLLPNYDHPTDLPTLTRTVPLSIKRRGIEMRLVVPGLDHVSERIDPALIKTIAKAHSWYSDWSSGEISSIRAIAEKEGVSTSHVGDLMRLAFLSPKIVEAILIGRQPVGLAANHLLVADLPLAWADQERLMGF